VAFFGDESRELAIVGEDAELVPKNRGHGVFDLDEEQIHAGVVGNGHAGMILDQIEVAGATTVHDVLRQGDERRDDDGHAPALVGCDRRLPLDEGGEEANHRFAGTSGRNDEDVCRPLDYNHGRVTLRRRIEVGLPVSQGFPQCQLERGLGDLG